METRALHSVAIGATWLHLQPYMLYGDAISIITACNNKTV